MNNYFSIGTNSADIVYGEDKNRIRRSLNPLAPNSPGVSGNPSGDGASGSARVDAPAAGRFPAANAGGNIPALQDSAAVTGKEADNVPGTVPPAVADASAAKADQAATGSTEVSRTGIVLDFSNKNLINSVILSEILGKPKFFRRGR
jgi:hypothetical protein